MKYVVFLGAPSPSDTSISSDRASYQWRTVTPQSSKKMNLEPPSAPNATSRRISAMYQNIIFGDKDDEDEGDTQVVEEELTRETRGMPISTADHCVQLTIPYALLRSYDLGRNNPARREE